MKSTFTVLSLGACHVLLMVVTVLLLERSCEGGVIDVHDFEDHDDFTGSVHQLESLGSVHLGDHYDLSHLSGGHEESDDHYGELLTLHGGSHSSLDYHDDFDVKPVPGINHGKGVLSYSTTYEFMDHQKHHHR